MAKEKRMHEREAIRMTRKGPHTATNHLFDQSLLYLRHPFNRLTGPEWTACHEKTLGIQGSLQ